MKGGGHRKFGAAQFVLLTDIGSPVDLRLPAGKHPLFVAVAVGQHQIEVIVRDQLFNFVQLSFYGQHGPFFLTGRGHVFSPGRGQGQKGGLINPAGAAQGGQLAEAVPAHNIRGQAEPFEDIGHPQADRADRRLGDIRTAQGCFFLLFIGLVIAGREHIIGKRPAAGFPETGKMPVGRRKNVVGFRKGHGQRIRHIDILASLPRKQKGGFPGPGFPGAVKKTVLFKAGPGRGGQGFTGVLQRRQAVVIPLQHQEDPVGIGH